jgi:hypothetical protein
MHFSEMCESIATKRKAAQSAVLADGKSSDTDQYGAQFIGTRDSRNRRVADAASATEPH